jgi:transcriptional regulator with XRE-family HTH domain
MNIGSFHSNLTNLNYCFISISWWRMTYMAAKSIGARIRETREARGFSASDLARLTGVTSTAVWNWEKNGTRPRANALTAISRALGVTEAYILSGDSHAAGGNTPRNVDSILAAAASQIADALGIEADRVKLRFEVLQA